MFRVAHRALAVACFAAWLAACGSDNGPPITAGAEDAQADQVTERGSDVLNEPYDASSHDVSQDEGIADSASQDAEASDERLLEAAPDGGTTDARDELDASSGGDALDSASDSMTSDAPGASGDALDANLADAGSDSASVDAADAGSVDAAEDSNSDATADATNSDATTDATNSDATTDATNSDATTDAPNTDAEAGVDPFFCLGAPLPTTAPATVNLQGVVDNANLMAIAGATVEGFVGSSASAAASATTAVDGSFAFDIASGGVPLDAYLHATKAGFFDTYHYPAYPITASPIAFTVLLVDAGTLTGFTMLAGVTQDASKGFMLIVVDDCATGNVAGATIDVSPAGSVVYLRNRLPSPAATNTDTSGAGVVFNVPAGQVTVSASVGATALRSHVVTVRANTLTRTSIRP
jgi:hypothetical protein